MESFYDREAGIAWGPVTKEEMIDDLLLFGKTNVERRSTLSCDPTFDNKDQRFLQIIEENKTQSLNVQDDILILSSDDETEKPAINQMDYETSKSICDNRSFGEGCTENNDEESQFIDSLNENAADTHNNSILSHNLNEVDTVSNAISNLHIESNILSRIPTPVNLDDRTYDDLDLEEEENILGSAENLSSCLNSYHNSYINNYHTPERDRSLPEVERSPYFPDTSEEHKEIKNNIYENHLEDGSLLNDTLAEMERLLNEGLNYAMPSDEYNENMDKSTIPEKSNIHLDTSTHTDSQMSISNIPILNITPCSEVKVNNLDCLSNYNSTRAKDTIKKLPTKSITKIPVAPTHAHNTKLPNKIEALIQQKSNIIKHEERINTGGTWKNGILASRLSEADLTNLNASLDTTEDLSIRCAKRAYIK
ncbi:hypothetical protein Trydic_g17214 [Trypoxylus dichotomus]